LDAINALEQGAKRYTVQQASEDCIIYFGFVKQVEIIGEAVYMLTNEFKIAHPEVEWEAIEGMRHVLFHGYYQITPDKIWSVISKDLPVLKPQIEEFLKSM